MADTKLKPCPFCGGTAIFYIEFRSGKRVSAMCDVCGARSRSYLERATWYTAEYEGYAKAAADWNRRVNENDN